MGGKTINHSGSLVMILQAGEEASEVGEAEIRSAHDAGHRHFDVGGHAVLLDFTDVDYVTEDGMAELLRMNRDMRSHGIRLLLCCFIPFLANKLQRMGLIGYLSVYADMSKALAALATRSAL